MLSEQFHGIEMLVIHSQNNLRVVVHFQIICRSFQRVMFHHSTGHHPSLTSPYYRSPQPPAAPRMHWEATLTKQMLGYLIP